jgi:uncharacterized membrane protein
MVNEPLEQTVVAVYRSHEDAEEAVRRLEDGGIPMDRISIVGRDWQVRQDVQGYYRPADAALAGAGEGAWMGGLFGMLAGFGFFLIPGAGPLLALGPLAGLIAGVAGGAGLGAIVGGLMGLGIPEEQALKYQTRIEAGEFLVVVRGTVAEIAMARDLLKTTREVEIQTHEVQAGQERAAA